MTMKTNFIEIKKEYYVIECDTADGLSDEVTRHLKTGEWFLVGGVSTYYDQEDGPFYCQAMVKIGTLDDSKNVSKLKLKDVKRKIA